MKKKPFRSYGFFFYDNLFFSFTSAAAPTGSAVSAAATGFAGKILIHPIQPIDKSQAYQPSDNVIRHTNFSSQ
jgi:citrate lyase beta subunit